jgi:nitronate monooxygenase
MKTFLTQAWNLKIPIIGAPMSPQAGGALAAAISNAGGLGMIGVGASQGGGRIADDAAEYRALAGERPFGIGLMTWAVDARPELLDAALAAKPFVVSMSFGDPTKHAKRIASAGVKLVSQVHDRASALRAEAAGAVLVVAQGTEAGGHTGGVGTLPLLQIVLESVRIPVVAAGGIATGRGLAAVLAAGAVGGWIGTPFLVANEARNTPRARAKIAATNETETVLTSVFDAVQSIPWPREFRGRAIRNRFSDRWGADQASIDDDARSKFDAARSAEDYDTAFLYAGQSVGLVRNVEPAGDIVRRIEREAEAALVAVREVTAR